MTPRQVGLAEGVTWQGRAKAMSESNLGTSKYGGVSAILIRCNIQLISQPIDMAPSAEADPGERQHCHTK